MHTEYKETSLGTFKITKREGNPLIVFLNSFGDFDTYQSFQLVIQDLPQEYGIFAPDYVNTGFSSPSKVHSYTIEEEAGELATLINAQLSSQVIVVAHSIGGVYALHMLKNINNVKGLIAIEPTTREIVLNPPNTGTYKAMQELDKSATPEEKQNFIKNKVAELFPSELADEFWATTQSNASQFTAEEQKSAQATFEQEPWSTKVTIDQAIPTIIFTERYRVEEYERSEFLTSNTKSEVIACGSFHYIQWEYPKMISDTISELAHN